MMCDDDVHVWNQVLYIYEEKSFGKNIQTNKRVVEKKKQKGKEKKRKRERERCGRKKFVAQICKMSAYTKRIVCIRTKIDFC